VDYKGNYKLTWLSLWCKNKSPDTMADVETYSPVHYQDDSHFSSLKMPPRPSMKDDSLYIYQFGGPRELWKHAILTGIQYMVFLFSSEWKDVAPKDWEEPKDLMDLAFDDIQLNEEIVKLLQQKGYTLHEKYLKRLDENEKILDSPGYFSHLRNYIATELQNHTAVVTITPGDKMLTITPGDKMVTITPGDKTQN
jgi:hypothetical protein